MFVEVVEGFEVASDGRAVWVNSPVHGGAVARFTATRVDVHTPDGTGCVDCAEGPCGLVEWARFQQSTFETHGVVVSDEHRPVGLT